MRLTINNPQMLETVISDMRTALERDKALNVSYEKAHRPRTMAQVGFVFGALISQITQYFRDCGFNLDEDDVRYKLYEEVSGIVPEMVVDNVLFRGKPRIKHIGEMDRETMSKFIEGIFTLLDQDPIYSGLKLSPDVFYSWTRHIDQEQIKWVRGQEFPERDADYLNYVREQPCLICGVQHRSEAHHLRDYRTSGMAIKSPDWAAIPLCHHCHMSVAHGTGFDEALSWIPLDLLDFTKICYSRYKAKMT